MKRPLTLVVSIPDQRLRVLRGGHCLRVFAISTAANGAGFEVNSFKTPTGRFRICEMIGDGMPVGTIFRSRLPVGLWRDGEPAGEDLILTRILRLDGLDPENTNTFDRCIYLHGTNHEKLLGQPCSHGCVRLANADMVELFDMVSVGGQVRIQDAPRGRRTGAAAGREDTSRNSNVENNTIDDNFVLAKGLPDHNLTPVMSTKSKQAAPTGVRYTDAQKKEIVDFVSQYNSEKGRGGQSAASKKYKVTPLTISAWLKAAGVKSKGAGKSKAKAAKAPKAAKPAKSAKAAKASKAAKSAKAPAAAAASATAKAPAAKPTASSKKGMRYPAEYKQEVIDFVNSHNAANGRGGQSRAAKKYNLSVLTVSSWLKGAGVKAGGAKGVKAAAVPAALNAKIRSLIELGDELRKAETDASRLRVKYDALRSSIQGLL